MDSRQLLASQRDAANQQLSLVTDMMMRMEEANVHLQQQNQTLQADNQRLQERNTTLQADNLRLQEQNRVLLASIATAAAAASSSSSSTPANRVRSGEPHLSPPSQQQQSGGESLNPQQQPQVPPNVQIRESISSQSATFNIEPSASSSINSAQSQNETANQPQSRQPDCHIAQPAAAANPEVRQPASLLNWGPSTSAFSRPAAYSGQQQQQQQATDYESDDYDEELLAEVKREIKEEENEMEWKKLQDNDENDSEFDEFDEEEEENLDNLEHHHNQQQNLPVNTHDNHNHNSRELLLDSNDVDKDGCEVMDDHEDGDEEYQEFVLNDRLEDRVINSGPELIEEEFDDQQLQQQPPHGHEHSSAQFDRQNYDELEEEEEGDNGTSDVHQQIDPSIAHHQHHSESTLVVNSAATTNPTTDGAEHHHHRQHQQQHGNFWIEIHEQTQPNWRRIMRNLNRLNDEQGQVMNANNNQQQFNVIDNNANIQADVMMEEEDDDANQQEEEEEVGYGSSDHHHHQQQHQQIDPITNDAQDNQGDVIVEELCDECESRSGLASKQNDTTATTTSSSSLTVPKSSERNKRKRVVLRVDEDDYDDNFSDDDKDDDYVLGSDDDDDGDGDNYDDDGDEDEDAEDTESDDGDVINEDDEVEEEDSDEDSPRAKRPRTSGPTTGSSTAGKKRPKQIIVRSLRCPQVGCADVIARGQLRIHLKTKHSIRPFACLLKACARTFDNSIVLGRHMRQSHNKVTKWQCAKCPRHFTGIQLLSNHNSLTHQLGLFQCSVCTFTSENRMRVHRHYDLKHFAKRHKFVCKYAGCNRAFRTEAHLIYHERSQHLDIKPYSCSWPHCGYSAVEHGTVVRHVRMRHLKLPQTHTEQKNRNIVDIRDPNKFVKVDKRLERRRVYVRTPAEM